MLDPSDLSLYGAVGKAPLGDGTGKLDASWLPDIDGTMAAVIGLPNPQYDSGWVTFTAGVELALSHGLGTQPVLVFITYRDSLDTTIEKHLTVASYPVGVWRQRFTTSQILLYTSWSYVAYDDSGTGLTAAPIRRAPRCEEGAQTPLPEVPDRRVAVRLTPDALRQVRGGHPWVFDGGIRSGGDGAVAGQLGVVFDDRRRFVAIGLWGPASPIRLRVLHVGEPCAVDPAFWMEKVDAALERRRDLFAEGGTDGEEGNGGGHAGGAHGAARLALPAPDERQRRAPPDHPRARRLVPRPAADRLDA